MAEPEAQEQTGPTMTTVPLVSPTSPRLGVSLAWCCGLVATAGLLVAVWTAPHQALGGHVFEDAATAILWAFLAGLLAQQTRHPAVRIFLAVACCAALAVAGGSYGMLDLPGSVAAAWLAGWIWTVSTFAPVTLLPAVFPSARLGERRVLVAACLLGLLVSSAGLGTSRVIEVTPSRSVPNLLALPFSDGLFLGGSVIIVGSAVTAIVDLWRRLRRSTGEQRSQLVPVATAAAVTLPLLVIAGINQSWGPALQLVIAPLVPVAMVLVILRRNLYHVELVVRRSLVFAGLTILVVGGYVLVVQSAAALLHRQAGTLASVVAAGVVALAFAPARTALQQVVGHWVYGDRATPDRALGDVTAMLTAAAEPALALRSATERLRSALRVPWVEVRPLHGVGTESGSRPSWATDALITTLPLRHLGTPQGALFTAPRSPSEPLGDADRALLEQLGTLIAAVLASAQLVTDLQRSRQAVVLAREEERRRVRRDLHDGIGPLLSALSTHADVAALRLGRDPSSVGELLDRVRQISEDAVTGLRSVVDDLQPVSLDQLGLDGALHELATTLSGRDVVVEVRGAAGADLPAAIEVATYRIAAEAATNALRHADAGTVVIRLDREPGRLELIISDDGHGFVVDPARTGVGLSSMRERAEEIGAGYTLASATSGTVIRVRFPIGEV